MGRTTFKKKITSPELISQINPKNVKLINLFLKEKDRKCSDATIKVYKSNLEIFFCWNVLYNDNKYFPEIKKFEFSYFFDFLVNEMKIQGKRFAHYRSILSTLSDVYIKFFDEEAPTFKNIINTIIEPIPKDAVRKKTILTKEDVQLLFDVLESQERYQEACLFALAIYGGARIAELLQYKVSMIDETKVAYGGVMLQSTEQLRTKGHGKQGKVMNKFIIKDLFLPYFYKWVEKRKEILDELGVEDHDSLFIKKNGEPATVHVIRRWTEKWTKILGSDCYMHMCRHYYVTMLKKDYGLSNDFIVSTMGWASGDAMLPIYNDSEDSELDWEDAEKLKEMIKSD